MLAREMIKHAAHKAGLGTATDLHDDLYAFGFAAINRAWQWVWDQYPFRGAKIPDLNVSTDQEILVLPPDVACVRSMRSAAGAMYPLNEIIESDHGVDDALAAGSVARWVNLPDRPCRLHPLEVIESLRAAYLAEHGGVFPAGYAETAVLSIETMAPAGVAPTVFVIDKGGRRIELVDGGEAFPLMALGEIDQLYLSHAVFSMVIEIDYSVVVTNTAETRTAEWCRCYNSNRFACRAVRLVPPPKAGSPVTFRINALRRLVPIIDGDSSLLLPDTENAVFDYLMAEFYEFNDMVALASPERQKAMAELSAVIERAEGNTAEREDHSAYPESSMFEE